MNIALCLYGQPRHLNRSEAFVSIRDNILNKYPTTVYAHAWWQAFAPESDYDISSWAKENGSKCAMVPGVDTPAIISKQYNPAAMMFERPKFFEPSKEVGDILKKRFEGNKFYSLNNISNIISQCTSISNVNALTPPKEDFDFYILARYDAVLINFPKLEDLKPGFYLPQGGHFNDLIHIYSASYLPFWLSLAAYVTHWKSLAQKVELPIPELFKYEHFRDYYNESELIKIPMYAEVIRE